MGRGPLPAVTLTVWSPSLTFAGPADPGNGFTPSPSGVVEYQIDGDSVTAAFRPVPGVRGEPDVFATPEVAAGMAELEAS